MDRLFRRLAACSLVLALPSMGCKTPRSEVPPNPSFSGAGQASAPVGFGSAPNPVTGAPSMAQGAGQYGIPSPGANTPSYGMANGAFGGPGTSGLSAPPTSMAPGGASNPMTGIPQTGTGSTGPAAGAGAAPTQNPF